MYSYYWTGKMNQLLPFDVKSVVGPLNEGIFSVYNICKCFLDATVDPTINTCSNYEQIRRHIQNAEQCLQKSETMIKGKLENLDECMCKLIREKQNVEKQKKEKSLALNVLEINKKSMEQSLKNTKDALEQAKKNVESARYTIQKEEESRQKHEDVSIAGAVLLAIPIAGWIAGPIMMSKGIQGSNEASKAIRAAEEEKQKCKERVNYYYANQLEYQSKIFWTQFEIQQTNNALNRIEVEIKKVQKNLEDTADIQGKVREAVNSLSVFSGRVTAVEKQTQRFILWKPVVKAMEDVVKAVVNIAENRLLYSDGAPSFINALRENVGRLALCNSPDNFEYGCSLSQYEYY